MPDRVYRAKFIVAQARAPLFRRAKDLGVRRTIGPGVLETDAVAIWPAARLVIVRERPRRCGILLQMKAAS
ncbi:hypothetical protein ABIC65_002396 [Sphingomonas trueperi]|uniref:hypothetical protein n=1 Tax=Sphingomonas trueperi TaxID=53317 RepID=UPI0033917244